MSDTAWDHVSTTRFAPRDRLSRWTSWGRRAIGNIQVRPGNPRGFSATASRIALGPATLSVMHFTAASASNPAPEVDDAIVFSLPQSGRFTYHAADGAGVRADPGDIYTRDLSRPWALSAQGDCRLITLRLPFRDFADRYGDPADFAGVLFPADRPEVACVTGILRSALTLLETGATPAQRQALAGTVLDSFRLLRPDAGTVAAAEGLSLRRQADLHISRHLDDPDLSPAGVARTLGVSPRRLQRVFQRSEETLQGAILDQRLERAAALLRSGSAGRGITALAMDLGFNDVAYFSRMFSRKYGHPPSRHSG